MKLAEMMARSLKAYRKAMRKREAHAKYPEVRPYIKCLSRLQDGRAVITIKCPFCGYVLRSLLWSNALKVCKCGAKHNLYNTVKPL